MFELEYLYNGWVKKDGVKINLVLCDWPNFLDTPIDFAFRPRLSFILVQLRVYRYEPKKMEKKQAQLLKSV